MKVLIADDDQTIRSFLRRILEGRLECIVTEAENGIKALELIQKVQPDFMVMDISMPEMSGDELLGKIRDMPAYKNFPVLVLSAISDREMIRKLLTMGVADYMLKPMEVRATFERIKDFMKSVEAKKNFNEKLTTSVPSTDDNNKFNVGL